VVLAKALMSEPRAIILDEPTHGIDTLTKRDIYLYMRQLVKGKAVVFISSEFD